MAIVPERRRWPTGSARRRPAPRASQRLEAGAASGGGVTAFTPYARPRRCSTRPPASRSSPARASSGGSRSRGRIPLGYYNDPEKTAETFVEVDGVRWVLTGDMATVDERRHDHTCSAGARCASTPAARRSSPKRSRPCSRRTRRCTTCWWSASPTSGGASGWPRSCSRSPGARTDPRRAARALPRASWPATRCPARSSVVDQVERSPAGKADYRWAKQRGRGGGHVAPERH